MSKQPHPSVSAEERYFSEAKEFVVLNYKPFGQSERQTFTAYPEALAAAEKADGDHRTALIYANTPAGRSVPIGKNERQKFLTLWRKLHA